MGGYIKMNSEDLKTIIIGMVRQLDESDMRFLRQAYTIVKRYFARKERH